MNPLIHRIYELLLETYGPQGWWPVRGTYFPREEDPFEVTVGAVLTQNTSWTNAARALEGLRERGLLDPHRIAALEKKELARIVRSSGYYNQKAERLQGVCRFLLHAARRDSIPTREDLLGIKGIGPETADSILLYAHHVPAFVIDAYTKRLFTRIGLAREDASYTELQQLFMENLPRDEGLYGEYHALIVRHGKEVCRKVPLCNHCVLARGDLCAFYRS